ncbi:Cytochrome P450 [Macrophomina phaseolina MS6]|uniref:Cytochrome P450 n=1 Tax=Macrophomina phaseolina (strain MS6) TaxID=1126212 RepID=K2S4F1_MACPH|nr:Cytochrome P450 [Macrophomina phaseolina MS6]
MLLTNTIMLSVETAALLLLSYSIYDIVYNIFFHPLRRFPGPKLAVASKLPFVFYRCSGLQARWTKSCHDKYGPVVRLAPNQLSFTSVDAWRDIYGHKLAGKGGMPKDLIAYGPDFSGSNGILRTNDEDHARHRRLLAHAFSETALRDQEPLIRKYVNMLVDKLGASAQASTPVDMVRMYNYIAFDIIADLTYGEALGMLENSDYTPWVRNIMPSVKGLVYIATIYSNFPSLGALLQRFLLPSSIMERRKAHARYSDNRVDARLARKTDRPDIWSFVLRHNEDDGKGLSLAEMHADGGTLMIAGTETTATLLSGLTFFLLRNPATLEKLTREVRSAFARPQDMDMATLGRLPYLNACLSEGFRIYPPVPTGLPRRVPPPGRVVCGENVPGGASVYVSHYAAYHSPENFCEPDSFVPERWLPEQREERFDKDVRDVVKPFSHGPRNCIGKNLAYHEIRLVLANVLWHYDLELCPESEKWDDQRVYLVWDKNPLMCKLKPVKRIEDGL